MMGCNPTAGVTVNVLQTYSGFSTAIYLPRWYGNDGVITYGTIFPLGLTTTMPSQSPSKSSAMSSTISTANSDTPSRTISTFTSEQRGSSGSSTTVELTPTSYPTPTSSNLSTGDKIALTFGITGTLASGIGAYYGWKAVKRRLRGRQIAQPISFPMPTYSR